jgi:hypothetical protein
VTWIIFWCCSNDNFARMLRRFIALTVLLAMASGPLLRMAVVGDYIIRLDTYTAACENLARPEMQCNGSCQLSKQLKAIEDQGAPEPLSAEWLKLKVGEFTVLGNGFDSFIAAVCPATIDLHVPSVLGMPLDAFAELLPPPKLV